MKVIKLTKFNEKEILDEAVKALLAGKTVVYPTDTSYGLGALANNNKAMNKVYKIKERQGSQPMHVLVPSVVYTKSFLIWNKNAQKLAKAFLPGPLSMELPLKSKTSLLTKHFIKNGFLGIRMPKNSFAQKLVKKLGVPVTATSANVSSKLSGGFDSYSSEDVISQFKGKKHKPDLVIDAGQLKRVKPSTFVVFKNEDYEIVRKGPISEREMKKVLK